MRLSEFGLLHGGYNPKTVSSIDKHYDAYFAVQLMTQGDVYLDIGRKKYILKGPTLWTGFPGPRIRFGQLPSQTFWQHRHLAIIGSLPARWIAEKLFPIGPVVVDRMTECIAAMDELITLVGRRDPGGLRRGANLLERLLLLAQNDRPQLKETDPETWLAEFTARVEHDPAWQPDYDRLARDARIPVSTMRKRFRRITGTSLHHFLIERRISVARNLLATSDRSLADIAAELGYEDVFFFSRQFRSYVGLPPSAYRGSQQ